MRSSGRVSERETKNLKALLRQEVLDSLNRLLPTVELRVWGIQEHESTLDNIGHRGIGIEI